MTPQQYADLEAAVGETEGVEASASLLIEEWAKAFEAVKDDPVAIQALIDRMRASKDSLAAKVAERPDPDPNT